MKDISAISITIRVGWPRVPFKARTADETAQGPEFVGLK
jgi:hypothetical protein